MKTARLTALAFTIAASLCAARALAAEPSDTHGSLVVGGVTRTYVYHVPHSLAAHPALVLMFHGHYMTGEGQSKLTHFDVQSDRYGFIVVYPDGIKRGWNDGRTSDKSDDVGFTRALIDTFAQRYHVDLKRVYATGFSNGATFSQYLGCYLSDRIAAIAPVSGSLPGDVAPGCHPKRALSVLEIGGTKDPLMPYDGGQVHILWKTRGAVVSAPQTIAFWAKNAHCSSNKGWSLPATPPSDGTSVSVRTYSGCAAGTSVELYSVNGGGHTWPDGPQYLPLFIVGKASDQLNASETIARFLLTKQLP